MKNWKSILTFWLYPFLLFSQSYQLDSSFGEDGFVKFEREDHTQIIIPSTDYVGPENILVSGNIAYFNPDKSYLLLGSFNEQGRLNEDFGNNGWLEIDTGLAFPGAFSQIPLSDGAILLAGYNYIIKIRPDGNIDNSFAGGSGMVVINDSVDLNTRYSTIKLQSDGKIIVSTDIIHPQTGISEPALKRYTVEGLIDSTFAVNGTRFSPDHNIDLFEIGKNDQIYIGSIDNYQLNVRRIFPEGILDWSFGDDGVYSHIHSTTAFLSDFKIPDDESIYILSREGNNTTKGQIIIHKLTNTGHLDPSFGILGKASPEVIAGNFIDNPQIGILKDGRIIIGGGYKPSSTFNPSLFLTEFSKNGEWIPYSEDQPFYTAAHSADSYYTRALILDDQENIFLTYRLNYGPFCRMVKFIPTLVGTKNIELEINPELFPNPTKSMTTLSYELNSDQIISISLLGTNGQMIQNIQPRAKQKSGHYTEEIKLPSDLGVGIYFVQLQTKQGSKLIPLSIKK